MEGAVHHYHLDVSSLQKPYFFWIPQMVLAAGLRLKCSSGRPDLVCSKRAACSTALEAWRWFHLLQLLSCCPGCRWHCFLYSGSYGGSSPCQSIPWRCQSTSGPPLAALLPLVPPSQTSATSRCSSPSSSWQMPLSIQVLPSELLLEQPCCPSPPQAGI